MRRWTGQVKRISDEKKGIIKIERTEFLLFFTPVNQIDQSFLDLCYSWTYSGKQQQLVMPWRNICRLQRRIYILDFHYYIPELKVCTYCRDSQFLFCPLCIFAFTTIIIVIVKVLSIISFFISTYIHNQEVDDYKAKHVNTKVKTYSPTCRVYVNKTMSTRLRASITIYVYLSNGYPSWLLRITTFNSIFNLSNFKIIIQVIHTDFFFFFKFRSCLYCWKCWRDRRIFVNELCKN